MSVQANDLSTEEANEGIEENGIPPFEMPNQVTDDQVINDQSNAEFMANDQFNEEADAHGIPPFVMPNQDYVQSNEESNKEAEAHGIPPFVMPIQANDQSNEETEDHGNPLFEMPIQDNDQSNQDPNDIPSSYESTQVRFQSEEIASNQVEYEDNIETEICVDVAEDSEIEDHGIPPFEMPHITNEESNEETEVHGIPPFEMPYQVTNGQEINEQSNADFGANDQSNEEPDHNETSFDFDFEGNETNNFPPLTLVDSNLNTSGLPSTETPAEILKDIKDMMNEIESGIEVEKTTTNDHINQQCLDQVGLEQNGPNINHVVKAIKLELGSGKEMEKTTSFENSTEAIPIIDLDDLEADDQRDIANQDCTTNDQSVVGSQMSIQGSITNQVINQEGTTYDHTNHIVVASSMNVPENPTEQVSNQVSTTNDHTNQAAVPVPSTMPIQVKEKSDREKQLDKDLVKIYDLARSKKLRELVDFAKTVTTMDLNGIRVDQTWNPSMDGDGQAYELLEKHYDHTEFPMWVERDGNCFLHSVSQSLFHTTSDELIKELRLIMVKGLIEHRDPVIQEAQAKGFEEPGYLLDEIAVAAVDGEYVRSYGILGFAFGSNINIDMVYPPENGPNGEDVQMYNHTFPNLPENSLNTNQTIKVSLTFVFISNPSEWNVDSTYRWGQKDPSAKYPTYPCFLTLWTRSTKLGTQVGLPKGGIFLSISSSPNLFLTL